jgi:hypothetical protein
MEQSPEWIPGFPDMWQPVLSKYRLFFTCATKLGPIIDDVIRTPIAGKLNQIVGRMVAAASNGYGSVLVLVANGYGHDAMKIARSIYEIEINALWLKNHPEDIDDFVGYSAIHQKQHYDLLDEEVKSQLPKEKRDQMVAEYEEVLPRFASRRDPTRPRNEWCKESIYVRAKEAEEYWNRRIAADGIQAAPISLHKTFYRQASSLHHLDFSGLVASTDADLNAQLAPSWEHLDDALATATASILKLLDCFDEMTGMGLRERLENGPNADYTSALKALLSSD